MTTFSDVFAAGLDQVRKSWGWFLACGILLTILGVVCIGKAQTATTFSILALGWVLAFSGVVWLINSFYAFSWHGFFLYLLNALIRGATGYLLIKHPDAGAQGVTMLLAALFIVQNFYDAGMIEFLADFLFTIKAVKENRVGFHLLMRKFDGHRAARVRIGGAINRSHAASGN